MATDLIIGKSVDEALTLTNSAVVEALEGLPPVKVHCSVLAEEAVKAAIADYYQKKGIDKEIPGACHCDKEECHCGK
jgi:nitrogen fixation NifU-like protein